MERDDATLVLATRGGDPEAFGLLLRRHLRAAHAVAYAVVGNRADADDVVQESFVASVERLEQCRVPSRFRAWLLAIVRSRALNFRRYRRLRQVDQLDAAMGVAALDQPDRDLDLSELRARLHSCLARLGDKERQVILLCDLEGWDHAEVAELLGIREAASRQVLHRARQRLRSMLGPIGTEEGQRD